MRYCWMLARGGIASAKARVCTNGRSNTGGNESHDTWSSEARTVHVVSEETPKRPRPAEAVPWTYSGLLAASFLPVMP
jgi:hypothetical protein